MSEQPYLEHFDMLVEGCADVVFNMLAAMMIATRAAAYCAHMTASHLARASGLK